MARPFPISTAVVPGRVSEWSPVPPSLDRGAVSLPKLVAVWLLACKALPPRLVLLRLLILVVVFRYCMVGNALWFEL